MGGRPPPLPPRKRPAQDPRNPFLAVLPPPKCPESQGCGASRRSLASCGVPRPSPWWLFFLTPPRWRLGFTFIEGAGGARARDWEGARACLALFLRPAGLGWLPAALLVGPVQSPGRLRRRCWDQGGEGAHTHGGAPATRSRPGAARRPVVEDWPSVPSIDRSRRRGKADAGVDRPPSAAPVTPGAPHWIQLQCGRAGACAEWPHGGGEGSCWSPHAGYARDSAPRAQPYTHVPIYENND